jgi:hypothetical protein
LAFVPSIYLRDVNMQFLKKVRKIKNYLSSLFFYNHCGNGTGWTYGGRL